MSMPKAQMKLNLELKRAVQSGDDYDEYVAIVQFMQKQRSKLAIRLKEMDAAIDEFYRTGGTMKQDENVLTISHGNLQYTIVYDADGQIVEYLVKNPGEHNKLEYVHRIYFCAYWRPYFESKIKNLDEELADLDNDNTLRGIFEVRKSIRGDRWMTMSALSGVNIQKEEDIDPYGIFSREDEE